MSKKSRDYFNDLRVKKSSLEGELSNDLEKMKSLQRQVSLEGERGNNFDKMKSAQKRVSDTKKAILRIDESLRNRAPLEREIYITEHAMLRYIERSIGIDVQEIKDVIVNEHVEKMVRAFGDGQYPIGGGLRAVVKKGVVVTVL